MLWIYLRYREEWKEFLMLGMVLLVLNKRGVKIFRIYFWLWRRVTRIKPLITGQVYLCLCVVLLFYTCSFSILDSDVKLFGWWIFIWQVVAIAVFFILSIAFYVFFAPFLGRSLYEYVAVGVYSFLVSIFK